MSSNKDSTEPSAERFDGSAEPQNPQNRRFGGSAEPQNTRFGRTLTMTMVSCANMSVKPRISYSRTKGTLHIVVVSVVECQIRNIMKASTAA